ncbi:MAG TPA: molybdenum cofactor biosynthesis protein [Ruminococcaceae bacterium]|nr:molybdenum cofactor biosynthesis protein [Oscillospiraceae bacterium]
MYTASVITVSDRAAQGIYQDKSGAVVAELLKEYGYDIINTIIIPDEKNTIKNTLLTLCEQGVHLIITTGGTGFAPRDITPEATKEVIEREAPGIAEYMRQRSMEITPRGMLSRGIAGIKANSLIINLPGSPKGATENLGFVLPSLTHGLDMLNGIKE